MVDLDNTEIGVSIKISSIKLPENVVPTIQGRDFVVATIAAPTIVVEPEKPAEETPVRKTRTTPEVSPDGTEKTAGESKDQGEKAKDQDKKQVKIKKKKKQKSKLKD